MIDAKGRTHGGAGTKNEDWLGFGAAIHAPADGAVVRAVGDHDDHSRENPFRPKFEDVIKDLYLIAGNYVLLDHGNGEFSLLAHMKKDSVVVASGHRVSRGQKIGEIGASGDAMFPHLHFQLQSDARLGEGLPSYFSSYRRFTGKQWRSVRKGQVDSGDVVASLSK